jgi:hypothetical protein
VSFSQHAIKQLGERLTHDPASYDALGDIFAYLYACTYFEALTLYYEQDGFTFYDICSRGYFAFRYVTDILGKDDTSTQYYYRLGYCPVEEESGFFLAKTLLYPGYRNTPEYGLLRNAFLPWARKQSMFAQCEGQTMRRLGETEDFSLLKWFHDNGVEQVKAVEYPIYDHRVDQIVGSKSSKQ